MLMNFQKVVSNSCRDAQNNILSPADIIKHGTILLNNPNASVVEMMEMIKLFKVMNIKIS